MPSAYARPDAESGFVLSLRSGNPITESFLVSGYGLVRLSRHPGHSGLCLIVSAFIVASHRIDHIASSIGMPLATSRCRPENSPATARAGIAAGIEAENDMAN